MSFLERQQPSDPRIFYQLHVPTGEPRGAVLLTHGYGEHSGRYGEVIGALTNRNLCVATYDLRGQGTSEGARGYIDTFRDYVRDLEELRATLDQNLRWKQAGPPVLLGHSLGGLISFHAALANPGAFRGLVLSSPFFGFAWEVPAPKRWAGHVFSKLMPTFALPSGIDPRDLTHDEQRSVEYEHDPLRVQRATARFFTEVLAAQESAQRLASSLFLPLFVFHAEHDRVASLVRSRQVFDRVQSITKAFRIAEGCFHEIFQETSRNTWIAAVGDTAQSLCQR